MNIDKKLRSVFTEDTELPEIVTEKSNAAYEQIRRKCRKDERKMKNHHKVSHKNEKKSRRRHFPIWAKTVSAVAAVLLLTLCICVANPVLAAKMPILGRIFEMLSKSTSYPGDYTQYAEPLQEDEILSAETEQGAEDNTEKGLFSQTVNGVTVTLSEVYCNEESLSISMLVEGPEPFANKIMKDMDGNQTLSLDAVSKFSFQPQPYVGDRTVEGTFLDEKTFAGIWRIDLQGVLQDVSEINRIVEEAKQKGQEIAVDEEVMSYMKQLELPEQFTVEIELEKVIGDLAEAEAIDWGMSAEEVEALSDEEFGKLYEQKMQEYGMDQYPNKAEQYWFEGPWKFTVPVSLNDTGSKTITINDISETGVGMKEIAVTPFEIRLDYEEGGLDCIPIVLDAEGKEMESAGDSVSVIPVADHDISSITVYLCEFEQWKGEIISHRETGDYQQYLEKYAIYTKSIELT